MKIGFFGDGPWAHDALEKIINASDFNISYVVLRFPNPDPILKQRCENYGLPWFCVKNVNDPDFINKLRSYSPDINVSMSFDQIIRADLRESADGGFINCHAGALPFYRGRNVINWALINGEQRMGITVHYVDDGVDTGDIINQRFFAIKDGDDYGSLLARAVKHCAEALMDGLELIFQKDVQPINQDTIHPQGTYYGTRTWGDEWIDWKWNSSRIRNFIRGISTPGPGARTLYKRQEVAILHAAMVPSAFDYICTEGQIVGRKKKELTVKTGDNILRISKVFHVDSDGRLGAELNPYPKIGERFGTNLMLEIQRMDERLKSIEKMLLDKNQS